MQQPDATDLPWHLDMHEMVTHPHLLSRRLQRWAVAVPHQRPLLVQLSWPQLAFQGKTAPARTGIGQMQPPQHLLNQSAAQHQRSAKTIATFFNKQHKLQASGYKRLGQFWQLNHAHIIKTHTWPAEEARNRSEVLLVKSPSPHCTGDIYFIRQAEEQSWLREPSFPMTTVLTRELLAQEQTLKEEISQNGRHHAVLLSS